MLKESTSNMHFFKLMPYTFFKLTLIFVATKRVVTCAVRQTKILVKEKCGYDISLGKLNFLKLFFVTNAIEKERALCMCKHCLNMRLKFDVVMSTH